MDVGPNSHAMTNLKCANAISTCTAGCYVYVMMLMHRSVLVAGTIGQACLDLKDRCPKGAVQSSECLVSVKIKQMQFKISPIQLLNQK